MGSRVQGHQELPTSPEKVGRGQVPSTAPRGVGAACSLTGAPGLQSSEVVTLSLLMSFPGEAASALATTGA